MRFINSHQVNPANDRIRIAVVDQPGAGGACHEYVVDIDGKRSIGINFQNGPIAEAGVNGLTHEALLAILADRLEGFQAGPYACAENAEALGAIQRAQAVLLERTQRRIDAGIEGTSALDGEVSEQAAADESASAESADEQAPAAEEAGADTTNTNDQTEA